MLIHEKEIKVTPELIDSNNHVNNVHYVTWVEQMANEHWDILKVHTPHSENVWFLLEHHIKYIKQVHSGDVLLARTYPLKPEGIRQPRKVEFYRDGELVADSRTLWVLMDREAGRIKRISLNWIEELEGRL